MTNRLGILNNKINNKWLNLSLDTFKVYLLHNTLKQDRFPPFTRTEQQKNSHAAIPKSVNKTAKMFGTSKDLEKLNKQ